MTYVESRKTWVKDGSEKEFRGFLKFTESDSALRGYCQDMHA